MIKPEEQNDVLKDFSSRLEKLGLEYMLTGSMALAHYAIPRMTADIDIVIELSSNDLPKFIKEFENDYYIPQNSARNAVSRKSMFNVLNRQSIVKIDCVIRKDDDFQKEVFSHRQRVNYADHFDLWIISKEGLILSKLNWAKNTRSEMQMRDVASILRNEYDEDYVRTWAKTLEIEDILDECIAMIEENYAEGYDA